MQKLNEEHIVSCMAACGTEKDLRDCHSNMMKADPVMIEYFHRKKVYNRIKNERSKQLRADALAPFEDEARRLKHGQKVYFKTKYEQDWFDLDNCRLIKGRKVEAGAWCRVWQYQPRAKRLWLCKPGTKCERKNVFNEPFSLSDMMHYGISRTEPSIRK